jgi:hypothetical protein
MPGSGISDEASFWTLGTWYTIQLTYDATTDKLTYIVKEKATGGLKTVLTLSGCGSIPATMHRLELTRLHMAGGGPGVDDEAVVDYDLDNVRLQEYH